MRFTGAFFKRILPDVLYLGMMRRLPVLLALIIAPSIPPVLAQSGVNGGLSCNPIKSEQTRARGSALAFRLEYLTTHVAD
jgi:hypothetical protein